VEFIIVAAVVVALIAGLIVALVRGRTGSAAGTQGRTDERPGAFGVGGDDRSGRTEPGLAELDPLDPRADAALDRPEALLEQPDSVAGRLVRLRTRLARSQGLLGQGLLTLLSRDRFDDETWQDIEDLLITSDLGVNASALVVSQLRSRLRVSGAPSADDLRSALHASLLALVDPTLDRRLDVGGGDGPAVILVVGVNGSGKTTTVAKLARLFVAQDMDVLLGAADTFRAAAADQLVTWAGRVGVPVVRGAEGADPASVAHDAVYAGTEAEVDIVIVDTAGRLHTKTGLMDELAKLKRVVERQRPVTEVLLVLDATTGQNGLTQAKVFAEVVDITGIVLTKLDGTAKGGIVVSVQSELGVPVKLVGLGEGPDDLAPFDAAEFVDALLSGLSGPPGPSGVSG
jgi:fused signal recognition particle receptor